jgi:hypothetical protein
VFSETWDYSERSFVRPELFSGADNPKLSRILGRYPRLNEVMTKAPPDFLKWLGRR